MDFACQKYAGITESFVKRMLKGVQCDLKRSFERGLRRGMNPQSPKGPTNASKKIDSSTQNKSEENSVSSDEREEMKEKNVAAMSNLTQRKMRAKKFATDTSVEQTISTSSIDNNSSDASNANAKNKENEIPEKTVVAETKSKLIKKNKKTCRTANKTSDEESLTATSDENLSSELEGQAEMPEVVETVETPSKAGKRKWTKKKSLDKDFIGCTTFEIGINRRRGLRFTKTKTKSCDLPTNASDDDKAVDDLYVMDNKQIEAPKQTNPSRKKAKCDKSPKIPTPKADKNDDEEMSICQRKMSMKPTEPSQKKAKYRKSSRTLTSKVHTDGDEDTDVYSYESTDETNQPNKAIPSKFTSDYDAETDEYETEEHLHFPKRSSPVEKSPMSSSNRSNRSLTQSTTSSGADDEASSPAVKKQVAKKFQLRVKLFRPKKGATRGTTQSKVLTRSRIKSVEVTEEVDANAFHKQHNTSNEKAILESKIYSTETSEQTIPSDSGVENKKVPPKKRSVKRRKSKRSALPKVDGSKSGLGLTPAKPSDERQSHDSQGTSGQLGTLSDIAVIFASDLENQMSRSQEKELPFETMNHDAQIQELHSEMAPQFPMCMPTSTSIVNEFHNNAGPVTNHVGYEWNTLAPNPPLYSPTISTSDYACSPMDPVRDSAILNPIPAPASALTPPTDNEDGPSSFYPPTNHSMLTQLTPYDYPVKSNAVSSGVTRVDEVGAYLALKLQAMPSEYQAASAVGSFDRASENDLTVPSSIALSSVSDIQQITEHGQTYTELNNISSQSFGQLLPSIENFLQPLHSNRADENQVLW